jgi:hypothetical protein
VARGALLIDRNCFPHHQALALRLVHAVTTQATDPASGMSALYPSDVRRLIQMAGKTAPIGPRSTEFRGVTYIVGGSRLRVLARRAMTGFARLCCSPSPLIHIHDGVRIFLKRNINILVTRLAGFRPDVFRGRLLRTHGGCSHSPGEKCDGRPNTAHGLCRPRMFDPVHDKPRSSLQENSYSPAHAKMPAR